MAYSAERSNAHPTKTPNLRLEMGADLSLAQPVNCYHACPHCSRVFPCCPPILYSAPPNITIPNLDLKLAPPEPTLVKPIPNRKLNLQGVGSGNGFAFELDNENYNPRGNAVGLEFKPPVEINFFPGVARGMSASADHEGNSLSDGNSHGSTDNIGVNSNWDLDLELKL